MQTTGKSLKDNKTAKSAIARAELICILEMSMGYSKFLKEYNGIAYYSKIFGNRKKVLVIGRTTYHSFNIGIDDVEIPERKDKDAQSYNIIGYKEHECWLNML